MPKVKYPTNCKTPADRTEFLYLAQEQLRLQHNEMGEKFREKTISRQDWGNYKRNEFDPQSEAISGGILENRKQLKHSTKYTVDLNNILVEE